MLVPLAPCVMPVLHSSFQVDQLPVLLGPLLSDDQELQRM